MPRPSTRGWSPTNNDIVATEVTYRLTKTTHKGKVWIRVTFDWANLNNPNVAAATQNPDPDSWEVRVAPVNSTPAIVNSKNYSWSTRAKQPTAKYTNGPNVWEDPEEDPTFDGMEQNAPYIISLEVAFANLPEFVSSIPLGKLKIESFSDGKYKNSAGRAKEHTVYSGQGGMVYIKIRSCPDQGGGGVVTTVNNPNANPDEVLPHYVGLNPDGSQFLWMFKDYAESEHANQAGLESGDLIKANFNPCRTEYGDIARQKPEVSECYTVEGVQSNPPDFNDAANVKANSTDVRGWQPKGHNNKTYIDASSFAFAEGSEPNDTTINTNEWPGMGSRSGEDIEHYLSPLKVFKAEGSCSDCGTSPVDNKSARELHEANVAALAKGGFGYGYSNSVYGNGATFNHKIIGGGQDPDGVDYNSVWTVGHGKQAMMALPAGATVTNSISRTIELSDPSGFDANGEPDGRRIVWGNGDEFETGPKRVNRAIVWGITHTVNEVWEMARVYRAMLRRDIGENDSEAQYNNVDIAGNGEMLTRNDSRGFIQGQRIQYVSASLVEATMKKIVSHTSTASVGIDLGEVGKMEMVIAYQSSNKTTVKDALENGEWSDKSLTVSASINMKGLCQWMAEPENNAYDGSDDTKGWAKFKDSLNISIDLGGGSVSTGHVNEYGVELDSNLNVSVDEDKITRKDIMPTGEINEIFSLQNMSFSYDVQMWNGWNLSVSGLNYGPDKTKDGKYDFTSLSDLQYTLSGSQKDPVKWTLGYGPGGAELGIATSMALIQSEKDQLEAKLAQSQGRPAKYLRPFGWDGLSNDKGFLQRTGISKVLGNPTCYLNTKAIVTKTTNVDKPWEYAIGASLSGQFGTSWLKGGIDWSVNMVSGSTYIGKSWKQSHPESWDKFFNKDLGDKLELNFTLGTNIEPVQGTSFSGSVDLEFQKTIVQLGEITGRLILNAHARATIGLNATGGIIENEDFLGFGATIGVQWENNILEWFGLPFNLHPRINAGLALGFSFGGYTRNINEAAGVAYQNGDRSTNVEEENTGYRTAAGIAVKPELAFTFHIGAISWTYQVTDSFRTHMRRKHNSVFGVLGLGNCPLLKVFGEKETIWQYVSRVSVYRAMVAIGKASEACADIRWAEWLRKYNAAVVELARLKNPQANGGLRLEYLGHIKPTKKTASPCGNVKGRTEAPKGSEREIQCGQIPKCPPDFSQYPNYELSTFVDHMGKNAAYWNSAGMTEHFNPDGSSKIPYPCIPSVSQVGSLVNEQMKDWDENNARCDCLAAEFHKLSGGKYGNPNNPGNSATGAPGQVYAYNWNDFGDELGGADVVQGVITRGLEEIDNFIMNWHRMGYEPTNTTRIGEGYGHGWNKKGKEILRNYQRVRDDNIGTLATAKQRLIRKNMDAPHTNPTQNVYNARADVDGLGPSIVGVDGVAHKCHPSWSDAKCFCFQIQGRLLDLIKQINLADNQYFYEDKDDSGHFTGDKSKDEFDEARQQILTAWSHIEDDGSGAGEDTVGIYAGKPGAHTSSKKILWVFGTSHGEWWEQSEEGFCGSIRTLIKGTFNLIFTILSWLPRKTAAAIKNLKNPDGEGGTPTEMEKLENDLKAKTHNPCGGKTSTAVNDDPYKAFKRWQVYKGQYAKIIHFLSYHDQMGPFGTLDDIEKQYYRNPAYTALSLATSVPAVHRTIWGWQKDALLPKDVGVKWNGRLSFGKNMDATKHRDIITGSNPVSSAAVAKSQRLTAWKIYLLSAASDYYLFNNNQLLGWSRYSMPSSFRFSNVGEITGGPNTGFLNAKELCLSGEKLLENTDVNFYGHKNNLVSDRAAADEESDAEDYGINDHDGTGEVGGEVSVVGSYRDQYFRAYVKADINNNSEKKLSKSIHINDMHSPSESVPESDAASLRYTDDGTVASVLGGIDASTRDGFMVVSENTNNVNYNYSYNTLLAQYLGQNKEGGLFHRNNSLATFRYLGEILTSPTSKTEIDNESTFWSSATNIAGVTWANIHSQWLAVANLLWNTPTIMGGGERRCAVAKKYIHFEPHTVGGFGAMYWGSNSVPGFQTTKMSELLGHYYTFQSNAFKLKGPDCWECLDGAGRVLAIVVDYDKDQAETRCAIDHGEYYSVAKGDCSITTDSIDLLFPTRAMLTLQNVSKTYKQHIRGTILASLSLRTIDPLWFVHGVCSRGYNQQKTAQLGYKNIDQFIEYIYTGTSDDGSKFGLTNSIDDIVSASKKLPTLDWIFNNGPDTANNWIISSDYSSNADAKQALLNSNRALALQIAAKIHNYAFATGVQSQGRNWTISFQLLENARHFYGQGHTFYGGYIVRSVSMFEPDIGKTNHESGTNRWNMQLPDGGPHQFRHGSANCIKSDPCWNSFPGWKTQWDIDGPGDTTDNTILLTDNHTYPNGTPIVFWSSFWGPGNKPSWPGGIQGRTNNIVDPQFGNMGESITYFVRKKASISSRSGSSAQKVTLHPTAADAKNNTNAINITSAGFHYTYAIAVENNGSLWGGLTWIKPTLGTKPHVDLGWNWAGGGTKAHGTTNGEIRFPAGLLDESSVDIEVGLGGKHPFNNYGIEIVSSVEKEQCLFQWNTIADITGKPIKDVHPFGNYLDNNQGYHWVMYGGNVNYNKTFSKFDSRKGWLGRGDNGTLDVEETYRTAPGKIQSAMRANGSAEVWRSNTNNNMPGGGGTYLVGQNSAAHWTAKYTMGAAADASNSQHPHWGDSYSAIASKAWKFGDASVSPGNFIDDTLMHIGIYPMDALYRIFVYGKALINNSYNYGGNQNDPLETARFSTAAHATFSAASITVAGANLANPQGEPAGGSDPTTTASASSALGGDPQLSAAMVSSYGKQEPLSNVNNFINGPYNLTQIQGSSSSSLTAEQRAAMGIENPASSQSSMQNNEVLGAKTPERTVSSVGGGYNMAGQGVDQSFILRNQSNNSASSINMNAPHTPDAEAQQMNSRVNSRSQRSSEEATGPRGDY